MDDSSSLVRSLFELQQFNRFMRYYGHDTNKCEKHDLR